MGEITSSSEVPYFSFSSHDVTTSGLVGPFLGTQVEQLPFDICPQPEKAQLKFDLPFIPALLSSYAEYYIEKLHWNNPYF